MNRSDNNERNDRIFDIIVRSYIETAEPVGSRTISKRYDLGLSPASIRNVMADLEEHGLIAQPHTSAGRVPTDRGYRYWVDELMQPEGLNNSEKRRVHEELEKAKTIENLAERVSKLISALTDNAAILYFKNLKRVSFLNILLNDMVEAQRFEEFLEEEPELFIEGVFRMFEQPEFQNVSLVRGLLQAFEQKYDLFEIFNKDLEEEGVQVHIGRETELGELKDVSLVVKDCYAGRVAVGGVAVVGPKRMRYAKIISVVDYVADTVTELMQRY